MIGSWPSAAVSTVRALTTLRLVERHHDVGGLAVLEVEQEGAQPPVGRDAVRPPASTSSLGGSSSP